MIAPPCAATRRPEIDWYSFLNRLRFPSPSPGSLEPLLGASLLVTGAGGSIGSALSLRLADLGAEHMVLLDSSEQALHRLQAGLDSRKPNNRPRLVLGDAGDAELLAEVFERERPRFIFHAAAYKHVPLLEEHPLAAIANNVLSTLTLAQSSERSNAARLVLLSTDKAVEPFSILGATKRVAELIALAHRGVVLRLGNVLGTEGSVSETFLRQIVAGGPVTITDREAQRYFLTCEEAVDLLLTASTEAEDGAILAPALERQHSIGTLAEFLVELCAQGRAIPIDLIGPRLGDKTSEKLWSSDETPMAVEDRGYVALKRSSSESSGAGLSTDLEALRAAVTTRKLAKAMEIVRRLVPDYVPSERQLSILGPGLSGGVRS